jgi:hypothetical protein
VIPEEYSVCPNLKALISQLLEVQLQGELNQARIVQGLVDALVAGVQVWHPAAIETRQKEMGVVEDIKELCPEV